MSRTGLLGASLVLAAMLACAVALLAAPMKPAEAAFPGENGDIAFQAELSGSQAARAYAAAPGGAGMRQLMFPPVYLTATNWSPDGTRVVSTSTGEHPDGEVYMVAADGSSLVNVTKTPWVSEHYADWFPSGTRLVYCAAPTGGSWSSTGPNEILAVSVDAAGNTTGTPKKLAKGCGEPAVSPDNSKIAFVRDNNVHVMRTGSPEGPNNPAVNLTKNSYDDHNLDRSPSPDWSPDSRKIAYYSGTSSTRGIWIMNRNGSKKKYLGSGHAPAFSPDGTKIAFVDLALQYSVETGGYEMLPAIWTMRKDGTRRTMAIGNEDRMLYAGQTPWDWSLMDEPSWQPHP